jgi:hypothetical protein
MVTMVESDGNAGVGVINVSPTFADIKLVERNSYIRVYLTISDYNSWADIYTVEVILEESGGEISSFLFQQYEDEESFEKINVFQESSDGLNLLNIDACDVSHSESRKTVEDRCHFDLRFVFLPTYFSQIHIISTDRAGAVAETIVEYRGGDMMRDQNTLLIPWIDGMVKIVLPPYVLDISLLGFSALAAVFLARKLKIGLMMQRVLYEK